eukprot:10045308-Lingulodinium_polyedra.AAC.1
MPKPPPRDLQAAPDASAALGLSLSERSRVFAGTISAQFSEQTVSSTSSFWRLRTQACLGNCTVASPSMCAVLCGLSTRSCVAAPET